MTPPRTVSRFSRRTAIVGAAAGLTILVPRRSLAAKAEYKVTEFRLPEEATGPATGRGINRKATVVGVVITDAGPQAVRSVGGELRLLYPDSKSSVANAINDAGRIVGAVELSASWWDNEGEGGGFGLGMDASTAYAVNRNNVIVGSSDSGANKSVAISFDGDRATELPSLGGPSSRALAVNNDGIVAGYSTEDDTGEHLRAVIWVGGEIQSIGTLGGDGSQAFAINGAGHVTGCAIPDDTFGSVDTAFIYRDAEMVALTRLSKTKLTGRKKSVALERCVGYAINDDDVVVGASMSVSENNPISVACRWIGDEVVDLNTLIGDVAEDIILASADGINADGEIVATGHRVGDDVTNTLVYRLVPR